MSYIIYYANQPKNDKLSGKTNLYRGLKIPTKEIDNYKAGQIINLTGYTSSSKDQQVALRFAMSNVQED